MYILSKTINHEYLELSTVAVASDEAFMLSADFIFHNEGSRKGCPSIPRIRKTVEEIFSDLGPACSKRDYRMRPDSFSKLHNRRFPQNPNPPKTNVKAIPNGPISS